MLIPELNNITFRYPSFLVMSQITARFILFLSFLCAISEITTHTTRLSSKKKNLKKSSTNKYMINKKGVKIHDDAVLPDKEKIKERKENTYWR